MSFLFCKCYLLSYLYRHLITSHIFLIKAFGPVIFRFYLCYEMSQSFLTPTNNSYNYHVSNKNVHTRPEAKEINVIVFNHIGDTVKS